MARPKNKKRLPVDSGFISDKKVSDIVYGKFQLESVFTKKGEARRMESIKLNKSEWAKQLQMSRPTLDTKIRYLKKVRLIIDKGEYFEIPEFGKRYFLIPDETLRYLVDTANADVIKVYSHLGYLWNFSDKTFTQRQILQVLGLNPNTPTNHKRLENILTCLENNGLIEYRIVKRGKYEVRVITNFNLNFKKRER